ncbi:MAG: hypothetical protein FWC39_00430 [Bacteroidetes bacterium]|nr:hypothetical protein [Bacteroidota bacterium]
MITVHYSRIVDAIIGQYYENYIGTPIENDLWIRVLFVRRIREYLSTFDISEAYFIKGKAFVDIEDICTIEFFMEDNQTEILIENIYFTN